MARTKAKAKEKADAYGIGLFDEDATKAHFVGVFGSILGGIAAIEFLSFIPGPGWLIKGGILAGKARLMGLAVIEYFEERSPLA